MWSEHTVLTLTLRRCFNKEEEAQTEEKETKILTVLTGVRPPDLSRAKCSTPAIRHNCLVGAVHVYIALTMQSVDYVIKNWPSMRYQIAV